MVKSPMHLICPPIEHNFMKEPIKIHVELSLLYKTLLMVEMRSKIFKDKGGTVQFLKTVDTLSMTRL